MEKIAWLFIYIGAFGISEYVLKYFVYSELAFYIGFAILGIFILFYYKQINSN